MFGLTDLSIWYLYSTQLDALIKNLELSFAEISVILKIWAFKTFNFFLMEWGVPEEGPITLPNQNLWHLAIHPC